jgi:hypothetical protein
VPERKGSQLREKAHGRSPIGRLSARTLVLLGVLVTGAAVTVPSIASAATTDPVTVAVSYTQTPVNPGTSETITYTVANTSSATAWVNFSDTLPSGVTVDSLPSETWGSGCGINNDTNAGGATSVTVANLEVPTAGSCTVSLSVDVAASAIGKTESDALTALSWAATQGGTATSASDLADDETTASPLVVVANPTITVTGVKAGAKYAYGQIVDANYSATYASGDSEASIGAFDSLGNAINSPGAIDTLQAGKQTLSVFDTSTDGASVTKNVSYTVEEPTLTKVTTAKAGSASYKVALPWAGKLTSELLDGKKAVGSITTTVKAKETAAVTVKLSTAGKKDLKKAGKKGLKLTLQASYKPAGSIATGWPTPGTAEGFVPAKAVSKAAITIK